MIRTSSNSAEARYLDKLNQCRFGTSHAASFVGTRMYYYNFTACDKFMAMQLLAIDQARVACEDMVRQLMSMPSIYKGRVKQLLRNIYSTTISNGSIPVCNKINMALSRNMTSEEINSFAIMAGYIDDAVSEDMKRLKVCIHTEVGRHCVHNQDAIAIAISAHVFTLICKKIMQRCLEFQHGSRYVLCINPKDPECRTRACELHPSVIDNIVDVNSMVIKELCRGTNMQIPYTTEITNGITIITNRMCNLVTIFDASKEAGIDLSRNSGVDIEAFIKQQLAKQEEEEARSLETPRRQKKEYSQNELLDAFSSKGWNVRTS